MTPLDAHKHPDPAPVREDIAIVGMSCLFAGSPDLETYWKNIVSKVDCISDPPADEWDPRMFYDPESKDNDRVYCKRGGYIGDLASFRPMDFGVMPVTVDGGEPDQWLALRVAHEALADAGYSDPPKEHVRTEVILGKGTYVNRGNLTVGYHGMTIEYVLQVLKNLHPEYTASELSDIKQELKSHLPPFSADTAPALIGNIIAGRIANRLDLMGPSFTVDAACASALLAIEIGVSDLISRKCDMVLAGGANANAPLPTLSLFCQLGALSRQETIRPFDKNADGTLLGEGLGMIVLKRRADAERDGNRIYAIIKGVGVASDGRAVHVMAPRVEGEILALQRAYEMAGVSTDTVGLIEAHGTATPVGDVVEVQALSKVFGERQRSLPSCAIGSVKSNIGHTMPAAGIAGVIKTAMALHHRVLPPTLHCDEPNPALQLDKSPFYVNTETRPWIHGADTPRRAGVNSFGFGGINGHVVLEEYTGIESHKDAYLHEWETEVCILEAASREELIAHGAQLSDYLAHSGEASLKDLAYTLNTRLQAKPVRLAIVASSKADLAQKLKHSLGRLADPQCRQIKDNKGIYFFEEHLQGKLAFVFPGEGAQYPNMLLDLCLHFPEVRSCFDLADRALIRSSRTILPSEFIFPRSTMSETERAEVEKALWQIDGAVEGVLLANWAMLTLLKRLEIQPDVIMGHSTGDYSAMFASNIIEMTSANSYVDTILAWNQTHGRLSQDLVVPEVALLAVGADSATVNAIAAEVGGELYLAMDNCPHQSVLVGSKESIDQAVEHVRKRALTYERLPFDRPYHTPMFQAYAEAAGTEFFSGLSVSAPAIDVYSCTTAARYPADVKEIRDLFVAHWVRPVLFSQTVETMYEDGVRMFVEVGPRGNLTAFISDILRGKPHLAMPANVARRSGITQINHLAGILAAQGIPMRLDYLYERREPQYLPWDLATSKATTKPQSVPMKISLAIPQLHVAPRKPKVVAAQADTVAPSPRNGFTHPAPPQQPAKPAAVNGPALAMQEYVKGMEAFLDTEQKVLEAFLRRARAGSNSNPSQAPAAPPEKYPLLGTVTSFTPGHQLTAVRQLSLTEDRFLREHALGGPVSMLDTELRPMVVLPLTMSMEVLAEAAAALLPNQVLVGMRDIQAHHWIRVDDSPVELKITARVLPDSNHEVEVEVRDAAPANPAVRGIMIFGTAYPKAPPARAFPLLGERRSNLATATLYDGRLMFHGPAFQGVASVDRSGQDGVVGQLQSLPTGDLFRSTRNPRFVTDPVVLDAAGQLVGFWAAEYLEKGFVVFPYHLESLRIFGPIRPAGERFTCRVSVGLSGNERIRSNIEILTSDGAIWMQLGGWEDRRFDPPKRFHHAWIAPHEALISETWHAPLAAAPNKNAFECFRVEKLFAPGNSLWRDLWASLVLTQRERKIFQNSRESEQQQIKWLSGRTAAKDAVRTFLKRNYRLELLPADIEIGQDEHGSFIPQGSWTQQLPEVPGLSLTHANGMAVALVGEGPSRQKFSIHAHLVGEIPAASENLLPDEHSLLAAMSPSDRTDWLSRLWCAKEAIAKALGRAAIDVRVLSLDPQLGAIRSTLQGKFVLTYTAREGDYLVATTLFDKEKS